MSRVIRKNSEIAQAWSKPAKYFTWHEVRCRHCYKLPPANIMLAERFRLTFVIADAIREALDRPLVASSWWRCEKHPVEARKLEPGPHFHGCAVDLLLHGGEVLVAIRAIQQLCADERAIAGRYGIGLRQSGTMTTRFMHVDVAGMMHRWSAIRPWVWTY